MWPATHSTGLADVDEVDGVVAQAVGELLEVPGVGAGDGTEWRRHSSGSAIETPSRFQKPTACRAEAI